MLNLIGRPVPIKGTATTTVTRITFTNPITGKVAFAKELTIKNTGASNALRVYIPGSDDSGALTYLTVDVNGGQLSLDGPLTWIAVATASSTTTYEIIAKVS